MSFEDLISAPVPFTGQKVDPIPQGETRCGYCIGHKKQCYECAYNDKKERFLIAMKKSLTFLFICCMFAPAIHTQGRVPARQYTAGFFIAPVSGYGSVPPCVAVMAPLPLRCIATGKAEPFFVSANKQWCSVMLYTENTCLQRNNSTLPATPTASEMAAPFNQLQTLDDFTGIMQVKGCTQVKIHFKASKVTIGFRKEGRGYGVRGNSLTEAFQAVVHMISNPLTA